MLGRRVRARQRAVATAVPDPHDDTVIPPLWLRTAKSPASQIELLVVTMAALVHTDRAGSGATFSHRLSLPLIPTQLRAFPIAAVAVVGCVARSADRCVYDPAPTFGEAVFAPWLCLQLAAVPVVSGVYGVAEGWLAVAGSHQWWPLTPAERAADR